MTKEIWRKIPTYKHYMVSDLGRVRSMTMTLFTKKTEKMCSYKTVRSGRILRPGRNTKYGHVTVCLGRRNSINVHRLVMWAFVGACPRGKEVLHNNGRASDNRLINLRYGTRSENNIDSSKMGRRKLNKQKVLQIRKHNSTAQNALKLSRKFKVSAL